MKTFKKVLLPMLIIALALGLASCGEKEKAKEDEKVTVNIAAAASLQNALEDEIIPEFEKENENIKIVGTYDASGKLQTQIEEGASIDIFFSAATKQMDALKEKDMIDKDTVTDILENKLVLIKGKDEKLDNIKDYKDIVNADTIALGDPASVPAGQYAKESFENLKILDKVEKKKVSYGTNVTEVLNWVAEGSAQVGVVYKSDALSMKDKVTIIAEPPADSVSKCIYPVAMLKDAKEKDGAKKFLDFLKKKETLSIFEDYGFQPNI